MAHDTDVELIEARARVAAFEEVAALIRETADDMETRRPPNGWEDATSYQARGRDAAAAARSVLSVIKLHLAGPAEESLRALEAGPAVVIAGKWEPADPAGTRARSSGE